MVKQTLKIAIFWVGILCFFPCLILTGCEDTVLNLDVSDNSLINNPVEPPEEPENKKPEENDSNLKLENHFLLHFNRRVFARYHEGWVYTTEQDRPGGPGIIYRMYPDGTNKHEVRNGTLSGSRYYNDWLYYISSGLINRMRLDGSEHKVYPDTDIVRHFYCYDDWIYYLTPWNRNTTQIGISPPPDPGDRILYRLGTDGNAIQKITENCTDFIVADNYIFAKCEITQNNTYYTKIIRFNLDGTDKKILLENNIETYTPVFAHDDYLYYTVWFRPDTRTPPQIRRMKFNGAEQQTIIEHQVYYSLGHVVYKNGFIYYTSSEAIYKTRIDGTGHVKLIDNLRNINSSLFDIIGNHIYYVQSNTLYRLSVNGGSPYTIHTSILPWFISSWFVSNNKFYFVEESSNYQ